MPEPRSVLVTRPEPGAEETGRRLAALGWVPVLAPALQLAPRPIAAPARVQALLLTSRAAARALRPDALPATLPVLAVGEATAAEARHSGFVKVEAAGGDAAALAQLAAARLDPLAGPLLLAVGAGYGREVALALRQEGFRVQRRVAYAAAPADTLPAPAREALAAGQVVAALFFSPRSVHCAISLIQEAGLAETAASITALALSPRVAAALQAAPAPLAWRAVRIADRPDQDSLLQLLGPRLPIR
ncbi:uroporphyrinogen-III synthase [Belnapia rosea]|uniref:Uroporphyrinogen-III synthase n=1 Tax=Belnapia rosea TaxID=938405 RepID=A0A1G6W4D6_9PROT|nr:uroporphyrinogen-III synthase [Belnapia rosea]SDB31284.1 uroporphyrinogen-III synthase [Belnapia rosea]SDD60658.1 uroporphyrinogen-III synthase [Belnapia rosea]